MKLLHDHESQQPPSVGRLWLSLGQISTSETMLMDCGLMDLIPTRIPYLIIPLELYDRSLL